MLHTNGDVCQMANAGHKREGTAHALSSQPAITPAAAAWPRFTSQATKGGEPSDDTAAWSGATPCKQALGGVLHG